MVLSPAILSTPMVGRNFEQGVPFSALIREPKFVVFLRHFGCVFCRENIKDLKKASETIANFPKVMFVHMGSVEEGDTFFQKFWDEVPAISDTQKLLYNEFGVERGSFNQLLGPSVVACGFRAVAKGNFVGKPVGDPLVMPGMFYVETDSIVWKHHFNHIGDHPDYSKIPSILSNLPKQHLA